MSGRHQNADKPSILWQWQVHCIERERERERNKWGYGVGKCTAGDQWYPISINQPMFSNLWALTRILTRFWPVPSFWIILIFLRIGLPQNHGVSMKKIVKFGWQNVDADFFNHFLRTPPMLIDGVCPKDMGHPRNDNVTGEHYRAFNEHFRSAYSSSPSIFRAISSYIHLDQNISSPYGSSRIFSGSAWIILDP